MTLFDISTLNTIKLLKQSNDSLAIYAANCMEFYHVRNYGKLAALINARVSEFSTPFFLQELLNAQEALNILNQKHKFDFLHTFEAYAKSGYSLDLLNRADENTFCNALPFTSPINFNKSTAERVQDLSIRDAKELLSHYDLNGAIAFCLYIDKIGIAKAHQTANLIEFYESQILRVAEITESDYAGNLFTKDFQEKKAIVDANALDLAEYLMESSDSFIWGNMSPEHQERLCVSIAFPNNKPSRMTREKFVNYVANYSTLPELEEKFTRQRALDRFIR